MFQTLRIPGFEQALGNSTYGKPERIAYCTRHNVTEGPLGGAAFNNEFGRPAILRVTSVLMKKSINSFSAAKKYAVTTSLL